MLVDIIQEKMPLPSTGENAVNAAVFTTFWGRDSICALLIRCSNPIFYQICGQYNLNNPRQFRRVKVFFRLKQ